MQVKDQVYLNLLSKDGNLYDAILSKLLIHKQAMHWIYTLPTIIVMSFLDEGYVRLLETQHGMTGSTGVQFVNDLKDKRFPYNEKTFIPGSSENPSKMNLVRFKKLRPTPAQRREARRRTEGE